MAATRERQRRVIADLGMFFAELGYLPSRRDYQRLPNRPKFLNVKEIDKVLGSWAKLLSILEKEQSDLWDLIHSAPKVEEPTIEVKMAKAKTANTAG